MSDYRKTLKSDESSLLVHYVYRPLAYPIAKAAHRLGVTANAVTILGGLCWMASLVTFPLGIFCLNLHWNNYPEWPEMLWPGRILTAATIVLWNAGTILDVADGSLARLTGTSSPAGFYLDYVFHLLFKPAFLLSVGIGVCFSLDDWFDYANPWVPMILFFSLPLAVAANWSAPDSAAEHVLCELKGKGRLPDDVPPEAWLGGSDSSTSESAKRRAGALGLLAALAKECLSYYGQFSFFSVLLAIDLVLRRVHVAPSGSLPCVTIAYIALFVVFLVRIPQRVARGYARLSGVAGKTRRFPFSVSRFPLDARADGMARGPGQAQPRGKREDGQPDDSARLAGGGDTP